MKEIPIPTIHLFPILEEKLMTLLRSLSAADWKAPTVAGLWTVKDVAAHLLDGSTRTVSMLRDHHMAPPAVIDSNEALRTYLRTINASWVDAMQRTSPALLIEWMQTTGMQYNAEIAKLDLFEPSIFPVSWAGHSMSLNWFHVAREYTERWHHQQQIREAVNKQGILTRELYYPVLDTFMMALPYSYLGVNAGENTVVQVIITGEAGGKWFLTKREDWTLSKQNTLPVSACAVIDGTIAWKLFTKSWSRAEASNYITLTGDRLLIEPALDMITVAG